MIPFTFYDLLFVVVGALLFLAYRQAMKFVDLNLSRTQHLFLRDVARSAILYIEQVYGSRLSSEKLELAIEKVEAYLATRGIVVDVDTIILMIEGILFEEEL